MVPTLAGVILLVFFLFKFFGGDPAEILGGLLATPEQIQAIRQQLGLNDPWYVQLWIFVKGIFSFNWGNSWATAEPVSCRRLAANVVCAGATGADRSGLQIFLRNLRGPTAGKFLPDGRMVILELGGTIRVRPANGGALIDAGSIPVTTSMKRAS